MFYITSWNTKLKNKNKNRNEYIPCMFREAIKIFIPEIYHPISAVYFFNSQDNNTMRENHHKRIFMTLRKIDYVGLKNCSHKHFSRFLLLFCIVDRICKCKLILQSDITIFRDYTYQCWKTKFKRNSAFTKRKKHVFVIFFET